VRDYEASTSSTHRSPKSGSTRSWTRYHALLTETGAEVTATITGAAGSWRTHPQAGGGLLRRRAVPVGSDPLPEYERLMKLDDELLRYLLVLHEGEPTAPMSIATRAA
jgi:hypothetical protein